tara:strand:- start:3314 stop:3697 length:384 start_codon:yes stop_codon:yes gene_type:complete
MKIIKTEKAPAAIGPYSQGVKSNGFIFTSGQIAINPNTGELVNENFRAEAIQVFKNLESVLAEGGEGFESIVKMNIYLADLSNFDVLNQIMSSIFNFKKLPSRSTVEVSRLPKDVNIEVDVIAEIRK